jgi:ankyrin repeat protein
LISEGFSPNVTDRYGNSSIMKAVRSKDVKSLRSFLKDKININAQNKDKDTALLLAVKGRQKEITDILLSVKKIDVNLQDAAGNSVLHYACKYDDRKLVEKLLQKGAMVFLKNAMNQTPINIAMQYDRKFLVKQLLKHIDKTTGMYKKVKILS